MGSGRSPSKPSGDRPRTSVCNEPGTAYRTLPSRSSTCSRRKQAHCSRGPTTYSQTGSIKCRHSCGSVSARRSTVASSPRRCSATTSGGWGLGNARTSTTGTPGSTPTGSPLSCCSRLTRSTAPCPCTRSCAASTTSSTCTRTTVPRTKARGTGDGPGRRCSTTWSCFAARPMARWTSTARRSSATWGNTFTGSTSRTSTSSRWVTPRRKSGLMPSWCINTGSASAIRSCRDSERCWRSAAGPTGPALHLPGASCRRCLSRGRSPPRRSPSRCSAPSGWPISSSWPRGPLPTRAWACTSPRGAATTGRATTTTTSATSSSMGMVRRC